MIGFNNIELITDRPLEVNLREIKEVKRRWPDRALVVSLMVPCDEESWKRILARVEETEADGVELNFGCPHGMSERGMGSAVGQVPEYVEMVARWCKAHTRMPVIVKLTPNITRHPQAGGGGAARRGGRGLAHQHHQLDHGRRPRPHGPGPAHGRQGDPWRHVRPGGEADRAQHGGRDRPHARRPAACRSPASAASRPGATRPSSWRSGAGTVQVCTAAMVYGFKIVEEMIAGLEAFMDERGFSRLDDFVGAAVPNVTDWQYLNLNYAVKARIDQDLCIKCGRCHIACEDTSHQAITHAEERRAPLRGDRRGMRRLQPLRRGLPGRELHHAGAR